MRLPDTLDALDVLRRFADRQRPVALLGAWHHGEALIAFDPVKLADDPFDDIVIDSVQAPDTFGGGWIGAWGYGLGHLLEDLGPRAHRPTPQPDHRIGFYDRVIRRVDGRWWLETLGRDDDADILQRLAQPAEAARYTVGPFRALPDAAAHQNGVAQAIEHIGAGDIFQVNLCTRLDAEFSGDPVELFARGVTNLAPAYAAYIGSPEGAVVSFSPELFLRRTGREVLTSPIKGTAPLSEDPRELAASAKDRAENIMIVDLMRNDLGRVCQPGTVQVPAMVRAERHAVWHLVSDVVGRLDRGVDDADLLRATFPPGSVTGAPKVRAMQIASQLEPTAREAYTGAIGHVSPAAGLELNVAIRTFEIAGDRIWLGVGGGIVADSTPEREWRECLVKARPLVQAIGSSIVDDPPQPPAAVSGRRAARRWSRGRDERRGVFTTLLVQDGVPRDLPAHLARLDASVRSLYGTTVRAGLEHAVVQRCAGLSGSTRLRVEAVPTSLGTVDIRLVDTALGPLPEQWHLHPCVVPGGWGAHKWVDRAVLDDIPAGADDLLLIDTDGSVLETGRASLFVVLDDGVHTAPLDGRILPGTKRAEVIETLTARGVPVHQRRLVADDLRRATEAFATNALRGVVPVVEIRGIADYESGPLAAIARDESASGATDRTLPRPERGDSDAATVLFVDNYDSFVFNLVQYVRELGVRTEVVRNDEVTVDQIRDGGFSHVILSPGPGAPADAGVCVDVVRRLGETTPILGVCLGHQAITEAYGGRVVRAPEPVHGKAALVHHDGLGLHTGLPSPLVVARYHSLVADESSLPVELRVTSRTGAGVVMGVRHRTHPVEGVQWHPESILTRHGHDLLSTFLRQRA